nr:hypothetical protein PHYPA_025028 [Physcomitrium patens]
MDVQMEHDESGTLVGHICNSWLPVSEEIKTETRRFNDVVGLLQSTWKDQNPETKYSALKWISLISTYLRAKAPVAFADLETVVRIGLDVILQTSDNLFIQIRWAQLLSKILKKFRSKLNLTVEWRPLYKIVSETHFKRRQSYEGLALKQIHLEQITSLIRRCRRFFPSTAAVEIWNEFRPAFDDLSHNSALEAAGFTCLFLPSNLDGRDATSSFLTRDWLIEVMRIWAAMPNCRFWTFQWATLMSRVLKHSHDTFDHWEDFVPTLFTFYLQSFEVPVGRASASSPIQREIPREVMVAFNQGWSFSASKVHAKSMVYLIKPNGAALPSLDVLVDLLEQYFHPSNGGHWTSSLEQFLQHLVRYFLKRLSKQRGSINQLGEMERSTFVKAMLRLIDRGQYSKTPALASTAASTASTLAFIEPYAVLPLIVSRFYSAMDTITATHQLQTAVTSLALVSRAIILASAKEEGTEHSHMLDTESATTLKDTLVMAMFSTLMGLDANDPPKTLATMQFYCSVLSSIGALGDESDGGSTALSLDWSQWLNEFLSRLFTLLMHLEPSNQSGPEIEDSSQLSSKTFLLEGDSYYRHVLELLFGRLTKSLYQQAVRKVAEFLHGQVLPGAVAEIGFLCSAAVYANPQYAVPQLLEPLINSVLSALADTPSTGFSGHGSRGSSAEFKVGLSPGLELSVRYQLNVLGIALTFSGAVLLRYNDLLIELISAAFDAPSKKVNEAGGRVLTSVLSGMVSFYPLDQFKIITGIDGVEDWVSNKDTLECPVWHLPEAAELSFANQLLNLHLERSLADLRFICQEKKLEENPGQIKEQLRVLLLRVDASLHGVQSSLPDFQLLSEDEKGRSLTVAGAAGASVGSRALREDAADTLHTVFMYLFEKRADDTALLMLLVRIIDTVVNFGWSEYGHWSQERQLWRSVSKRFSEPKVNYITNADGKGKRRPRWLVVEIVYAQSALRASQAGYRHYSRDTTTHIVPSHVTALTNDLLRLSLHRYDAVRTAAAGSLLKVMKRFPSLVKECMPMLTSSLQDPAAIEDSALGACQILSSRSIIRHLMQDWNDLVEFLMAILNSSHHDSVKAQAAINEIFIVFNVRFGGLPARAWSSQKGNTGDVSLADFVSHIKSLGDGAGNMHWRYTIMAQAMLLLLAAPGQSSTDSFEPSNTALETRQLITGQFLNNLKSELPPLRPLSVAALLLLLQPGPYKVPAAQGPPKHRAALQLAKQSVATIFQEEKYAETVVNNLGFDHIFAGESGRSSRSMLLSMPELGLTALLPSFVREWPRTRTWNAGMSGEAFSSNHAKFFKRLVQEGGETVLIAVRGPLEVAVQSIEERGKQCVAAELVAGVLHSDVQSVLDAWSVWIRPLLRKALLQSTVESAPEWAACVRFAVTGKGRLGRNAPLLRSQVLESLVEPLAQSSASTSLVTKRLMFLRAALVEVSSASWSTSNVLYQSTILSELMSCMTHPAAQVREGVGNLMCVVASNLEHLFALHKGVIEAGATMEETLVVDESVKKWSFEMVEGATAAAVKIQAGTGLSLGGTALAALGGVGPSSSANEDDEGTEVEAASKWMETTLYFVIASLKSGRAVPLNGIIVGLLRPILSIQECSDKELSSLAKRALQLLNSAAPFDIDHIDGAVIAVLGAATDANWHTRVSALTFLQSLVYRHTFILGGDATEALWRQVQDLLSDPQLEVRESAATTLSGMLKGTDSKQAKAFREQVTSTVSSLQGSPGGKKPRKRGVGETGLSINALHRIVLGLAACILSVPYDMPSWLPEMVTQLVAFSREPAPVRSTVSKTIAEFRRTHSDTWSFQKAAFSDDQLEVLSDLTSSASYFA